MVIAPPQLDFPFLRVYPKLLPASEIVGFRADSRRIMASEILGRPSRRALPACLLACILVISACHKTQNTPPVSEQSQNDAADTAQAAPKGNPDEATKALPSEFPKNLPVFPGAAIEHVRKPKGSMREIFLVSGAQLDQLVNFYKDQLAKAGYDVTSTLKMAARRTWSCDFHKGGQQCSVMLFPNDQDKTKLTIDLIYQMPATVAVVPTLPQETFDVIGPGQPPQPTQNQTKTNLTPNKSEKRKSG